MTPREMEIYKDATRHAARHRWTITPLAGGLITALAIVLLWQAGTPVDNEWFWAPAVIASMAGANVTRIFVETINYATGLGERPEYITPAAGQRTRMQELPHAGKRYLCAVCGRHTERILEIKFTSPRRNEIRRFGMHENCETTAGGQALIAAEKLLAEQGADTFTPAETINSAMEQAKRDFRKRES